MSVDVLLVAAAIAIYIADSAQLLYANEGLVYPAGRRWRATLGSKHFTLLGRALHIPAPLAPHRPLFRLTWSASDAHIDEATHTSAGAWQALAGRFVPLAVPLWVIGVGLFALLPLGLFSPLGHRALLPGLLLVYGGTLWALAWAWARRDRFRIKPMKAISLAFECLVCPPCALNLVRKLSLRMDETLLPGGDLIHAAETLLCVSERRALRLNLIDSLEGRQDVDEAPAGAFVRRMRDAIAQESRS